VLAEWVMACVGGAAITGWALYLGCGPLGVGLLGALPYLAQLMQLPGAWLTSRLGSRRAALLTVGLSRQAFLPLMVLPFVPLPLEVKRAVLVACAAVHHGCGILCNNAWVTWMGDLVPPRVRGAAARWRSPSPPSSSCTDSPAPRCSSCSSSRCWRGRSRPCSHGVWWSPRLAA
jgi:hypothetical protein